MYIYIYKYEYESILVKDLINKRIPWPNNLSVKYICYIQRKLTHGYKHGHSEHVVKYTHHEKGNKTQHRSKVGKWTIGNEKSFLLVINKIENGNGLYFMDTTNKGHQRTFNTTLLTKLFWNCHFWRWLESDVYTNNSKDRV